MQISRLLLSSCATLSLISMACSTPQPAPDSKEGESSEPVKQPLSERADRPEEPKPSAESFIVEGTRAAAAGMTLDKEPQSLFALWSVTSGTPDYVYMFGEGKASEERFVMTFAGPPPADAINSYGVGVALIGGLVSGSEPMPQGRCDEKCVAFSSDEAEPGVRVANAFTDRYAVLWVDPTKDLSDPKLPEWIRSAPKGYSCAKGVPAKNDGFDAFEQIDCSEMILRVDSDFEFVNWT